MFNNVHQIVLGLDRYLDLHQSEDDRVDLFRFVFSGNSQVGGHHDTVDDREEQKKEIEEVVRAGQVGEEDQVEHQARGYRDERPVQTEHDAYEIVVLDVLAAQGVEMLEHQVQLLQVQFQMQIFHNVPVLLELFAYVGESQTNEVADQVQNQMTREEDALYHWECRLVMGSN